MKRPAPTSQVGFTLLEVVIAMALTAMLLSMLSAGTYAVVRDWRAETTVLDTALDQTLVVLQLERALHAAFPHSYIDYERLSRHVFFQGTDAELSFVSTVSPRREPGLTAWRLQSDAVDGLSLTLAQAFSDDPTARLEALEPVPLLPGYTASFRYLMQRNAETKEWLEEWDGAELQSLPLAVHVVLEPIAAARAEEGTLEIVAPLKTWRHREIDPVIPVLGIRGAGL